MSRESFCKFRVEKSRGIYQFLRRSQIRQDRGLILQKRKKWMILIGKIIGGFQARRVQTRRMLIRRVLTHRNANLPCANSPQYVNFLIYSSGYFKLPTLCMLIIT